MVDEQLEKLRIQSMNWNINGTENGFNQSLKLELVDIPGTDLLEVPTILSGLFLGYVRRYTPTIWPEKWYSTSILTSWISHRINKDGDFINYYIMER